MANHTINFTTSIALGVDDYFLITIPATVGFGSITGPAISCPLNTTASAPSTSTAKCTATGIVAAGAQTITISSIANPAVAGPQIINANNYASTTVSREDADMVVAIINNVTMSASVPSTLTFSVSPVATGTVVNNATTTGGSATTSINFGNLQISTSTTMGQELRVTTNATYGFTVTVEQNNNLTANSGATIDSFRDGTPPGAPIPWEPPASTLGATSTYGHMGLTTNDSSLSSGNPYNNGAFTGFSGSSTREVMYSNGPADGSTPGVGKVQVAYRIAITGLQEAGDYTNTITYIATPVY